jgi:NAD(P)-dependent dehydrogenase (short-subunit alcohol dehydrogenase family)
VSRGWAIVAGASGGVGSATAVALARSGWDVAVHYRSNHESAKKVAGQVEVLGRQARIVQADLADADAARALVDLVGGDGLRGVVYAAGPPIPMEYVSRVTPEMFARQLTEDALGCFHLLQPSIAHLRAAGGGAVVAVATPALRRYAARDVLSVVPKGAIEQLVRAIAAEEGKYGIRCNALGVGHLSDGMVTYLQEHGYYTDEYLERALQSIALRRSGTSQEIATVVDFLMSDAASYLTGQLINVDGGFSL